MISCTLHEGHNTTVLSENVSNSRGYGPVVANISSTQRMKYARIVPPEINNASPHNDRFMALSADSLSILKTMHVLRDDG